MISNNRKIVTHGIQAVNTSVSQVPRGAINVFENTIVSVFLCGDGGVNPRP